MRREVDWNGLLAECLGSGGDAAWRELVTAMVPVIRGAVRRGASPEWLEDFSQGLLLKLCEDDCRRLRAFDPARGVPFPAFLRVIAVRHRIDIARRRGDEDARPTVDPAVVVETLGVEPAVLRDREHRELRKLIERLTPEQGLAASLLLDGLTNAEIAVVLGISENGVALRLWRARQELREKLTGAPLPRKEPAT